MYKILIVDDEADVCNACANYLAKKGNSVDMAATGEEALDKVKQNPPDIVLLDITMPGMGGLEALRKIKALSPDASVIMVTASEDAKISDEAMRSGASGYIAKPVKPDILENLIKTTRAIDETKKELDSPGRREL